MVRISKAPDERRQELLQIGYELYKGHGSKGISIQEVVKRANVATGLFYYYFPSKTNFIDEVLNGVLVKQISVMQQVLQEDALTPMMRVEQALQLFWRFLEQFSMDKKSASFQTVIHFELEQRIYQQLQPLVKQVIIAGVREGVFNVSNASLTAGFIVQGLSSVAHNNEPIAQHEVYAIVLALLGMEEVL